MNFIEYWNALVKRNPGFASNGVVIKLRVKTLKSLLEEAHIQGLASHKESKSNFENIFSAFGGK